MITHLFCNSPFYVDGVTYDGNTDEVRAGTAAMMKK